MYESLSIEITDEEILADLLYPDRRDPRSAAKSARGGRTAGAAVG
jgi:hypothetical protein